MDDPVQLAHKVEEVTVVVVPALFTVSWFLRMLCIDVRKTVAVVIDFGKSVRILIVGTNHDPDVDEAKKEAQDL